MTQMTAAQAAIAITQLTGRVTSALTPQLNEARAAEIEARLKAAEIGLNDARRAGLTLSPAQLAWALTVDGEASPHWAAVSLADEAVTLALEASGLNDLTPRPGRVDAWADRMTLDLAAEIEAEVSDDLNRLSEALGEAAASLRALGFEEGFEAGLSGVDPDDDEAAERLAEIAAGEDDYSPDGGALPRAVRLALDVNGLGDLSREAIDRRLSFEGAVSALAEARGYGRVEGLDAWALLIDERRAGQAEGLEAGAAEAAERLEAAQ